MSLTGLLSPLYALLLSRGSVSTTATAAEVKRMLLLLLGLLLDTHGTVSQVIGAKVVLAAQAGLAGRAAALVA